MFHNGLPFSFLKIDNSFRTNESVAAGDSSNASNRIPLRGLCVCLVHGMKVWTTSSDLHHDDQRPLTGASGRTYRLNDPCVRAQVRLIRTLIYHVTQPSANVGVLKSAIFELQFETGVDTQEQSIFPAYMDE